MLEKNSYNCDKDLGPCLRAWQKNPPQVLFCIFVPVFINFLTNKETSSYQISMQVILHNPFSNFNRNNVFIFQMLNQIVSCLGMSSAKQEHIFSLFHQGDKFFWNVPKKPSSTDNVKLYLIIFSEFTAHALSIHFIYN